MNRFDCSIKFYSDPILFTGKNGTPVVKFRAEIRRDDGSGVDYFNFVAFGKRAEFIKKYFQKRSCAVVEGTLRNDDWKKEDGTKVYRDVVVVKRIEFAGSKKKYENEIQNGNGSRPGVPPVQNAQREPAYYKQNSAADFASPYTGYVYGSAPAAQENTYTGVDMYQNGQTAMTRGYQEQPSYGQENMAFGYPPDMTICRTLEDAGYIEPSPVMYEQPMQEYPPCDISDIPAEAYNGILGDTEEGTQYFEHLYAEAAKEHADDNTPDEIPKEEDAGDSLLNTFEDEETMCDGGPDEDDLVFS